MSLSDHIEDNLLKGYKHNGELRTSGKDNWVSVRKLRKCNREIIAQLRKEGEASIENFDEEMLQFSLRDIKRIILEEMGAKLI